MLYDAAKEIDVQRANTRLQLLIAEQKRFELIEKKPIRSISQNSYLHLILSWFALEYGETMEYVKQDMFKKQVNKAVFKSEFANKKTGEIREEYRSTKELNTAEMTFAIDRFRDYAANVAGIYLPQPDDLAFLQHIDDEINKNKNQLYL